MKGLEIAEDFFLNWGEPFLEQEFPALMERYEQNRKNREKQPPGAD